jgi:hypothetical protein
MKRYYFARRLGKDIVVLEWEDSLRDGRHRNVWTRMKLRGRERVCAVTNTTVAQGSIAWSPITNGQNRMDRICDGGIEELEKRSAGSSRPSATTKPPVRRDQIWRDNLERNSGSPRFVKVLDVAPFASERNGWVKIRSCTRTGGALRGTRLSKTRISRFLAGGRDGFTLFKDAP